MDILMHGSFTNVKVRSRQGGDEWYMTFGRDEDMDRGSLWLSRADAVELVRVLTELLEAGDD